MVSEYRILHLLADMLEYPQEGLLEKVCECEALVLARVPEAGALLSRFRAFVKATSQGRLEEIYTGTFDLDAACHPYVGYQLFGESYKRSVFLWELKDRYRAQGYVMSDRELPDRVSVLLRFLTASTDVPLNRELISEALLPALEAMAKIKGKNAGGAGAGPKPYQDVLLALQKVLQSIQPQLVEEHEATCAGGSSDD